MSARRTPATPQEAPSGHGIQHTHLGIADVVLLCVAAVLLVALAALRLLWVPSVARMLQDFGGSLPRATRLVLSGAYLPVTAALVLALGGVGAWRARTGVLALACAMAAVAVGLVVWGMYAPIFELAGNIAE